MRRTLATACCTALPAPSVASVKSVAPGLPDAAGVSEEAAASAEDRSASREAARDSAAAARWPAAAAASFAAVAAAAESLRSPSA